MSESYTESISYLEREYIQYIIRGVSHASFSPLNTFAQSYYTLFDHFQWKGIKIQQNENKTWELKFSLNLA